MAIPTKSPLSEIDNMPGEVTPFTIGNPLWVMRSLANLYSNKELAVTREYSTNARDSHIEAGKADVPIEVTLPSLYDPYFTVQDYGVGMSEAELKKTYTSFGDSTKRESNEQTGVMGFGSKSAITYTNQFTIVSVKDGFETIGVISRKPDYSIELKTVMNRAVDKPNGVQIKIPVHNHEEFRKKAMDFYRFWIPGTVLVDGKEPQHAVGEKINDNLYFSPNPGVSYVVMGSVGYRIANPEHLFRNSKMNNISFVAYVENGSVEFTPGREDLMYTDLTKATLQKVISDFEHKILVEAKAQIEKAATHQEAWDLWAGWRTRLGNNLFQGLEYKGEPLKEFISVPNSVNYKVPRVGDYNPRYNTSPCNSYLVKDAKKTLFIGEFQSDRPDGTNISVDTEHKKKARRYFDYIGLDARHVIFNKKAIDCPWIPKENVTTWAELLKNLPKMPRIAPQDKKPKRPKGLFDFYTNQGMQWEQEIPDGADVFYITAANKKKYSVQNALDALDVDDSVVVVVLAVSRIEKFKRDNFAAREFVAWAKSKVVVDTESLLDDRAKQAMCLSEETKKWIERLDVSKIDDPKWSDTKELMKHGKYSDKYNANLDLARAMGMRYTVQEYRGSRSNNSLIEEYPLLEMISWPWTPTDSFKEETLLYINAAYAAKKGKP